MFIWQDCLLKGGPGKIVEALLGKKPTYNHGKINKIFKIWVVGMVERIINLLSLLYSKRSKH